jgi:hypothetical protein
MGNEEKLLSKLKSIKRGAYWFGIIGRLSIMLGLIAVSIAIFAKVTGGNGLGWVSTISSGVNGLIFGYLFLLGRDAFEAIEELIREVGKLG